MANVTLEAFAGSVSLCGNQSRSDFSISPSIPCKYPNQESPYYSYGNIGYMVVPSLFDYGVFGTGIPLVSRWISLQVASDNGT